MVSVGGAAPPVGKIELPATWRLHVPWTQPVGIDDAAARIGVHPRRTHLVPAALEILRPIDLMGRRQRREPADAQALQLLLDDLLAADHGAAVDRQHAPVKLGTVQAEGVALVLQA